MHSGDESQKRTLTSVEEKKQDLNHSDDKPTDATQTVTCMLYQHTHMHTEK